MPAFDNDQTLPQAESLHDDVLTAEKNALTLKAPARHCQSAKGDSLTYKIHTVKVDNRHTIIEAQNTLPCCTIIGAHGTLPYILQGILHRQWTAGELSKS